MMNFKRYPHVKDLLTYYANSLRDNEILNMLDKGVATTEDAKTFAKFIWRMVDQMAIDNENSISVLGRTDNTDLISDLEYEVSLYLSNEGYEEIWDQSFDEN